ncbi:MAG: flagellar biosynthesis anti-sigma factor FlgM [Pseudomonadota bacterium]
MSNDIDGISPNNLSKIAETSVNRKVDGNRNDQAPQTEQRDSAKPDTVALTDSARALERAESKLSSAAVVDTQRVDSVRADIDNGTYKIDDQAIADKILRSDQERG